MVATFSTSAFAAARAQATAADFGAPPAGAVPILFNDQHVYASPGKLKAGRVIAALLRGGAVLVPLRSMFEQMGGTVAYNATTQTVDVSKPGADVRLTIGKNEVVLNGETRPLDVPPETYEGAVLVPVRVIAESLGAYVLWVADKRIVVVRYASSPRPMAVPSFPATPAPAPTRPAFPAPGPTDAFTPTPVEGQPAEFFVAGDALFSPKLYNEFVPGSKGDASLGGRAGVTVPVSNLSFVAEATVAQYRGPHGSGRGFVTVLGPSGGSVYVAPFTLTDTDIDGRIGVGIARPKLFAIASFERFSGNYGYPALEGAGAGIEKVPDFHQIVDLYGSYVYYPQISGTYGTDFGPQKLRYIYTKYQGGITISPPALPVFLDVGFTGNHSVEKENAPGNRREASAYAGLGLHF